MPVRGMPAMIVTSRLTQPPEPHLRGLPLPTAFTRHRPDCRLI
jgi:hypothetical protein